MRPHLQLLPLALLALASAMAACGRGAWHEHTGADAIPGGDLFVKSWTSPRDSGLVAVALVSADSVRFAGFQVVDRFPGEIGFDVTLRLPRRGEAAAGSLSFRYEAAERTVAHGGRTFDVSMSPLFVIPLGAGEAALHHLPTDAASVTLPPEAQRELRRRFPQAFR